MLESVGELQLHREEKRGGEFWVNRLGGGIRAKDYTFFKKESLEDEQQTLSEHYTATAFSIVTYVC